MTSQHVSAGGRCGARPVFMLVGADFERKHEDTATRVGPRHFAYPERIDYLPFSPGL